MISSVATSFPLDAASKVGEKLTDGDEEGVEVGTTDGKLVGKQLGRKDGTELGAAEGNEEIVGLNDGARSQSSIESPYSLLRK